ncbi:arginine/serine-rich coiled-coil protein 2 isoform X2 [Ananas comosus]|nr:arginine/serine-rich coiled-coil protein 2 isoform X2 [Ananas comosus]
MDLSDAPSPQKSDFKPSFRKPSNDIANRKYRRHSPAAGSDSSSSGDSLKHERSRSPIHHRRDRPQISEGQRRKEDGRETDKERSYKQSSRAHESQRHFDRYGDSHESRAHDDYSRHHRRRADADERNCLRSSRSERESRTETRSNYRSRVDDGYGEKLSKSKDRDVDAQVHHRYNEKETKKANSSRDNVKSGERDRHRERRVEEEKRDHYRGIGKWSSENGSSREEIVGSSKEGQKSKSKEVNEQEHVRKRKQNDRESECYLDRSSNMSDSQPSAAKVKLGSEHGNAADDKPSSSSKQVMETSVKESGSSTANHVGTSEDLNAAKIAAMKAAELVNKNLTGFGGVGGGVGCLSTDQKKKLLWGSKKSSSTEEQTANRWDLNLFADRERQEKFNKLMSLRLPWYVWPFVGCEGKRGPREQAGQQGWEPSSQEAGGARHGFGEAIHRRPTPERWSYCRSRSVVLLLFMLLNIEHYGHMVLGQELLVFTPFCCMENMWLLWKPFVNVPGYSKGPQSQGHSGHGPRNIVNLVHASELMPFWVPLILLSGVGVHY